MIVTSNRTRELHDALKRRCLYEWIDYPEIERELEIVAARVPQASERVVERVCRAVALLREQELYKRPGIGETITWAQALLALDIDELDATLFSVLKVREDVERVRGRRLARWRLSCRCQLSMPAAARCAATACASAWASC